MKIDRSTAVNNRAIAIVGGTFDPIHKGHIQPVVYACKTLGIDKVFWVPCKLPPHKAIPSTAEVHRINMLQLVTADKANHELCTWELNRSETSYSFHTVSMFAEHYRAQQRFFFMGADSLLNFTQWYRWQDILSQCHLVVSARPGFNLTLLPKALRSLIRSPQELLISGVKTGNIIVFDSIQCDMSSTEVRESLRDNNKIAEYLEQSVYNYILKHNLYSK